MHFRAIFQAKEIKYHVCLELFSEHPDCVTRRQQNLIACLMHIRELFNSIVNNFLTLVWVAKGITR
jgi:hypothetical protein